MANSEGGLQDALGNDGLHPNRDGYAAMRPLAERAIARAGAVSARQRMTMHPNISINTLCFAPAGLDELTDKVARIGARGISPDLEQVLAFGVPETARLFRDAGLAVADPHPPRFWLCHA